ncbi:MAG: hypothetical protein M1822_008456 [Bathelium mastoideum]|nr:MAG: hypothetical protein M1822_008456 [Bathelium mastoideum]
MAQDADAAEPRSSSTPLHSSHNSPQPLHTDMFSSTGSSVFPTPPSQDYERPLYDHQPLSAPIEIASSSTHPLLTLHRPASGPPTRAARFEDAVSPASQRSTQMAPAEKDVDDPTISVEQRGNSVQRSNSTTLVTLSRLFAAQAVSTPGASRQPSYNDAAAEMFSKSAALEPGTLQAHLYTRGLLSGRYSDIIVYAFGTRYPLHRLVLDQAPFFATMFSGPWTESTNKEVTLHPEDIDCHITQPAFELALRRLYGCCSPVEEEAEAIGLFATSCWLEMQELVEASTEAMLRQMSPPMLASLIRLVTSSYYGRAGDKVLESAKAMLCRDGWRMPLKYWDGIPGDIVREIVGGDGFFVAGEWDRWVLSKRLLDRRLKTKALEAGLTDASGKVAKAPESLGLMALRFDAVYRKSSFTVGPQASESHSQWLALYTAPEVEPLLVLLDEGIHYIHLDFEKLQYIRTARDILGLPVMPEKVITNALWMSMELRQRVLNAHREDHELNLSRPAEDMSERSPHSRILSKPSPSYKGKAKKTENGADEEDGIESGSWDANAKPRKFWIPSTDCNIVMGGNAEPVVTTTQAFQRHASRLSATLQPQDLQWATDFAASANEQRPMTPTKAALPDTNPVAYSHFPPFRFAAEFPNPRLLKDKKRVYSRTVFYAGSMWNLYIQKVRSSKNPQLGVYLHRSKERETEESIAGAGVNPRTVDERIGELERSMLLRGERSAHREARREARRQQHAIDDGDTSGSGGDADTTLVSTGAAATRPHAGIRSLFGTSSSRHPKSSQSANSSTHARATTAGAETSTAAALHDLTTSHPSDDLSSQSDTPTSPSPSSPNLHPDGIGTDDGPLASATAVPASIPRRFPPVSALPPYIDARPQIKTYFKIYSPSRGGRMLAVYESAPDKFNFSQSWGWKSSTLMLDEGILGAGEDDGGVAGGELGGGRERMEREEVEAAAGAGARARKEGTLRFMVVFGNV